MNDTFLHVLLFPDGIKRDLLADSFADAHLEDRKYIDQNMWVAEIDGLDPRYGFSRKFVKKRFSRMYIGHYAFHFRLEFDKLYEEKNFNHRRFFKKYEKGEDEFGNEDVIKMFNVPTRRLNKYKFISS